MIREFLSVRFLKRALPSLAALLVICGTATAAVSHPLWRSLAEPKTAALPGFTDLSFANQVQQSAEPAITGPGTKSCVVTLMLNKQFRNTAYPPSNPTEPDRNYTGTYAPPAGCPAPWAKVVLNVATNVSGDQFDRLLDVYVGGALFLSSSTSEPCCTGSATNLVSWTAQRDVSAYAPLLAAAQPVSIDLGNVVDSTYTGIYTSTATLTFYEAGPAAPAVATADIITGVHSQVDDLQQDGYYQVSQVGQVATQTVTFPRNLMRLQAELFAQGHGACEEFWWGEPSDCGIGTPYREVAVYIDGKLAGAAPVYPVTFTGASGPGFWEPIPSPRAWNLRPYLVDLSPFVGTLTDGAAHQIGLAALDAAYLQGDVWDLAANLLEWVDHGSSQTTGALTTAQAPAGPTDTTHTDRTGEVEYTDNASHTLNFSGWVQTSTGRITTTVSEAMSANSFEQIASGEVSTNWEWKNSTTTVAGATTVFSDHETYSIFSTPLTHFGFTETRDTQSSGPQGSSWTDYTRKMETSDATGLAYNGASNDRYRYADSNGACVDHNLVGLAGFIVSNSNVEGKSCVPLIPAQ